MVKPMRCAKCEKIVGWAESVVRDEKVFHRDCFRCNECNKKLERGGGLKDNGEYYCSSCHSKQFGAMGFRKGVVKKGGVMRTVAMNMQPPFAHVSTKPVTAASATKAPEKEEEKLFEFQVAMFGGETIDELKEYLAEGNCDFSAWDEETFKDLMDHIKIGKCELGLDTEGNALRVATMAKVFIYDEGRHLVLFNPLNSFESDDFVQQRRQAVGKDMQLLQRAVGENEAKAIKNAFETNLYKGVAETLGVASTPTKGKEAIEIPGALIFETSFSPFKETPRDAGARVFSWRFGLEGITGRIFNKVVPKKIRHTDSVHYPGLRSEYHVYQLRLKPEYIVPLQKSIPVDEVVSVGLDEITNTGINTHWYSWIKKSSAEEMITQLKAIYQANEKVKVMVGTVDFDGPMAQGLGKLLNEEAALLELWN